MQYYSIGTGDGRAAEANRKPRGEKDELKGRQEAPHSILGIVAAAMERFGQPKEYILWRMSYAELMIMTTDVSRYVTAEEVQEQRKRERPKEFTTEYFQTRLGGNETGKT